MRLEILPGPRAAARRAAEEIAEVLRRRGRPRLVLASGRTMLPVYAELVRLHRGGRASFRRAETFNLDELRVAPEDARSFRAFMERHLFSKVDLPAGRIHFLRGDAADPDGECRRYERALDRAGIADLAIAGVGVNGHVAYLEPGRALPPRTARVRLSASTRRALAAGGMRPVPREALTMGIETILSARAILLVATGRRKAGAVEAALEGPVTSACPASFLSLHPRLTVLLDRKAASRLQPWFLNTLFASGSRPGRRPKAPPLLPMKVKGGSMPDKETLERAQEDKREGKSPGTQAGEFVREEIEHVREGKHGARSTKQAIAIGLSKARRAGVKLPPPKKGKAPAATRRKAARDVRRGRSRRKPSATRARAVRKALKREGHRAASRKSLSRQARRAAVRRSAASRSRAAKKAAATRKKR